jgi:hypothetical protein
MLVGCNGLTGASDLELVECIHCDETSVVDSGAIDAATEDTGTLDTALPDTSPEQETSIDAMPETKSCTSASECDDMNPCTTDRCPSTNTCTFTLIDRDDDGEAASALGACGLDCNDANKDVFSKQTGFFTASYTNGLTVSWDYNCDGMQEMQYPALGKCVAVGGVCMLTEGWQTSVPGCGKTGKYMGGCLKSSFGCIPGTSDRVQACR